MTEVEKEIKRLEEKNFDLMVKAIKVEAVKEFAEMLTNMCNKIIADDWNKNTGTHSWASAYEQFALDIELMCDFMCDEMVGDA